MKSISTLGKRAFENYKQARQTKPFDSSVALAYRFLVLPVFGSACRAGQRHAWGKWLSHFLDSQIQITNDKKIEPRRLLFTKGIARGENEPSIGNGIIMKRLDNGFIVETDFGGRCKMTAEEIFANFRLGELKSRTQWRMDSLKKKLVFAGFPKLAEDGNLELAERRVAEQNKSRPVEKPVKIIKAKRQANKSPMPKTSKSIKDNGVTAAYVFSKLLTGTGKCS